MIGGAHALPLLVEDVGELPGDADQLVEAAMVGEQGDEIARGLAELEIVGDGAGETAAGGGAEQRVGERGSDLRVVGDGAEQLQLGGGLIERPLLLGDGEERPGVAAGDRADDHRFTSLTKSSTKRD